MGKITSLATQYDSSHHAFQEKIDAVNEFMRNRKLPFDLRKKILEYYRMFWARGIYFDEQKILNELSYPLRRDVMLYIKRDVIRSVPLFKEANPQFVSELSEFFFF